MGWSRPWVDSLARNIPGKGDYKVNESNPPIYGATKLISMCMNNPVLLTIHIRCTLSEWTLITSTSDVHFRLVQYMHGRCCSSKFIAFCFRSNFIALDVYYGQLQSTIIDQSPAYTLVSFFSKYNTHTVQPYYKETILISSKSGLKNPLLQRVLHTAPIIY